MDALPIQIRHRENRSARVNTEVVWELFGVLEVDMGSTRKTLDDCILLTHVPVDQIHNVGIGSR